MNKQEFIKEYNSFLKKENLTNEQAWVGVGGTLLLLGLREETRDIDMNVPKDIFDRIRKHNYPEGLSSLGNTYIKYNHVIDIFVYDGIEKHTIIEGIGSSTIQEVLKSKRRLNRPKDQQDIINILEYMKKHKLAIETIEVCISKLPTIANW